MASIRCRVEQTDNSRFRTGEPGAVAFLSRDNLVDGPAGLKDQLVWLSRATLADMLRMMDEVESGEAGPRRVREAYFSTGRQHVGDTAQAADPPSEVEAREGRARAAAVEALHRFEQGHYCGHPDCVRALAVAGLSGVQPLPDCPGHVDVYENRTS